MSGRQIDVFSLTDKELADTLREYGATCGPIIDQTREVYRRKLLGLISESGASTSSKSSHHLDREYDSKVTFVDQRPPTTSLSRGMDENQEYTKDVSSEQPRMRYSFVPSAHGVKSDYPRMAPGHSTSASQSAAVPARRSYMLPIIGLIVVLVLVFLIFRNMEPAYSHPGLTSDSGRLDV